MNRLEMRRNTLFAGMWVVTALLIVQPASSLPSCLRTPTMSRDYGNWCNPEKGFTHCYDVQNNWASPDSDCTPISPLDAVCRYHRACMEAVVPTTMADSLSQIIYKPQVADAIREVLIHSSDSSAYVAALARDLKHDLVASRVPVMDALTTLTAALEAMSAPEVMEAVKARNVGRGLAEARETLAYFLKHMTSLADKVPEKVMRDLDAAEQMDPEVAASARAQIPWWEEGRERFAAAAGCVVAKMGLGGEEPQPERNCSAVVHALQVVRHMQLEGPEATEEDGKLPGGEARQFDDAAADATVDGNPSPEQMEEELAWEESEDAIPPGAKVAEGVGDDMDMFHRPPQAGEGEVDTAVLLQQSEKLSKHTRKALRRGRQQARRETKRHTGAFAEAANRFMRQTSSLRQHLVDRHGMEDAEQLILSDAASNLLADLSVFLEIDRSSNDRQGRLHPNGNTASLVDALGELSRCTTSKKNLRTTRRTLLSSDPLGLFVGAFAKGNVFPDKGDIKSAEEEIEEIEHAAEASHLQSAGPVSDEGASIDDGEQVASDLDVSMSETGGFYAPPAEKSRAGARVISLGSGADGLSHGAVYDNLRNADSVMGTETEAFLSSFHKRRQNDRNGIKTALARVGGEPGPRMRNEEGVQPLTTNELLREIAFGKPNEDVVQNQEKLTRLARQLEQLADIVSVSAEAAGLGPNATPAGALAHAAELFRAASHLFAPLHPSANSTSKSTELYMVHLARVYAHLRLDAQAVSVRPLVGEAVRVALGPLVDSFTAAESGKVSRAGLVRALEGIVTLNTARIFVEAFGRKVDVDSKGVEFKATVLTVVAPTLSSASPNAAKMEEAFRFALGLDDSSSLPHGLDDVSSGSPYAPLRPLPHIRATRALQILDKLAPGLSRTLMHIVEYAGGIPAPPAHILTAESTAPVAENQNPITAMLGEVSNNLGQVDTTNALACGSGGEALSLVNLEHNSYERNKELCGRIFVDLVNKVVGDAVTYGRCYTPDRCAYSMAQQVEKESSILRESKDVRKWYSAFREPPRNLMPCRPHFNSFIETSEGYLNSREAEFAKDDRLNDMLSGLEYERSTKFDDYDQLVKDVMPAVSMAVCKCDQAIRDPPKHDTLRALYQPKGGIRCSDYPSEPTCLMYLLAERFARIRVYDSSCRGATALNSEECKVNMIAGMGAVIEHWTEHRRAIFFSDEIFRLPYATDKERGPARVASTICTTTKSISSSSEAATECAVTSAFMQGVETGGCCPRGGGRNIKQMLLTGLDTLLSGSPRSRVLTTQGDRQACAGCVFLWESVKQRLDLTSLGGDETNPHARHSEVMSILGKLCGDPEFGVTDVFFPACERIRGQAEELAWGFATGDLPTADAVCVQSQVCVIAGSTNGGQEVSLND